MKFLLLNLNLRFVLLNWTFTAALYCFGCIIAKKLFIMTTTTFHFASAQEIDAEFINSVKKAFQARSISITVAEEIAEQDDDDDDDDDDDFYLSPD